MSTWVLAIPKNIPCNRSDKAKGFLDGLLHSVGKPGADDLFVKAAKSANGVGVTADPDGCPWNNDGPGRKRDGKCIYLKILPRPRTKKWPEISDRLSYVIGDFLMDVCNVDEALQALEFPETAKSCGVSDAGRHE
ncbi:MAG TPA: hypothetical protein VIX89_15585 [Bryobacteraceae bacterium]